MNIKMSGSYPLPSGELEEKIGYCFNDKSILQRALTHSSYANENRGRDSISECNERIEFLGDSVLSIIATDYLVRRYAKKPEGELSRIRAGAVCETALDVYASEISLGSYLLLGHGEENNGGRERPSIIADAFEALIAAIYLDGGFEAAKVFVLPRVKAEIDRIVQSGRTADYKTTLQQIVQQEKGELLQYVTISENGPPHRREFEVEARINSNVIGHGKGTSKRDAEQMAAREALELFGEV